MVEASNGHRRVELTKFHAPAGGAGDQHASANTLGIRHVAFAVDDIEAAVAACGPAVRSSSAGCSATTTAMRSATSAARGIIVELTEQIG